MKQSRFLSAERAADVKRFDSALIGLAILLSLISTTDRGAAADLAITAWFLLFILICKINFGAALGIYTVSATIYSVRYVPTGVGSVFERPDNFALAVLLFYFGLSRYQEILRYNKKHFFLDVAIIGFLVMSMWQMALTESFDHRLFSIFMRTYGFSFVFLLLLMHSHLSLKELHGFVTSLIILGVYSVWISFLESRQLYGFMIPPWIGTTNVVGGRSGGLVMQPPTNGFLLGLIYWIALGNTYLRKIPGEKSNLISVAFILFGLFLTRTRGAWLAVLCAGMYFLFTTKALSKRRAIARVAVLANAIAILVILITADAVETRVDNSETVYYRINVWIAGLRMALESPIFGLGFGAFAQHIGQYTDPTQLRGGAHVAHVAHNIFINLFVEHGIVGLILYCFIFLTIHSKARKASRSLWPKYGPSWVTSFALIYFVNIQFLFPYHPVPNLIYFAVMGIIIGINEHSRKTKEYVPQYSMVHGGRPAFLKKYSPLAN